VLRLSDIADLREERPVLYRQAAGSLRAVRPGWRRALAGTYLAAAIAAAGPLVLPAVAVQPVIGSLAVSPRVADITLTVQVPAGWPAPQMQPGDTDGFTSCADCTTDPWRVDDHDPCLPPGTSGR
jgi:hypothetical protein